MMSEYPYSLTVDTDWPSIPAKVVTTKLQIYFQSKKRSQGGDCVVEYSDQSKTATIHFKSPQTRTDVLAKGNHAITINDQELILSVHLPTDTENRTEKTLNSTEAGNDVRDDFVQPDPVGQNSYSVRVSNLPPEAVTNKELLEQFCERFGGPVKAVRIIPEEQAAVITFQSKDGVQKTLGKTVYYLCGASVKVQSYPDLEENQSNPQTETADKGRLAESPQSAMVVVEKIPHNFSREMLLLMMENISGEEEFLLELICEANIGIVTFSCPAVADKFLMESRANKKFQEYGLRGRALEKSRSVKVEDLPEQYNNTDLLEIYFEKWGGEVTRIDTVPEENAAIVTFQNPEAVENILKKEHHIGKTQIIVYPYFESLGVALKGKNRTTWTLPTSFREKLHPSIKLFLHKTGLVSSLCDQMSSHFCDVNMDNDDVLLSPLPGLLRQKSLTKKQIECWKQNTTDRFRDIISNYAVFEHAVIPSLWATMEKDIRSVVKDKAALSMDTSSGVLTLAGMTTDINMLKPILVDYLRKAQSQVEREKNITSDGMVLSQAMHSFLQQDGLLIHITAKYPDLEVMYKKGTGQLVLKGLSMEILEIKNWILERQVNVKQKTVQIDSSLIEFLRSVDCDEMSQSLFTHKGISAVYHVEKGDIVVIGSSDRVLTEAERRLETALAFHRFHPEDLSVLNKPELLTLIKELCDTYNLSNKKTVLIKKQRNNLVVSGFKEPVTEIRKTLEEFIQTHSRTEEAIRVKSNAVVTFIKEKKSQFLENFVNVKVEFDPKRPLIRLSGERKHVCLAVETFKNILESLHTDKLIIHKAGAKKYFQEQGNVFLMMMIKDRRFVVVLEQNYMMDESEDDYDDSGTQDFGQVYCEVQTPGGFVVTVRKANICQFKVDAVVNAANEDLRHIGGVASALLKAAGPCLQEYSDQYVAVNGPLLPGRAITTEAGHLPCKYVVHAVGPRYSDMDRFTAVKLLRQAVRESLTQAARMRCSSIAVPVISSGIFGFPLELCTETIAKELRSYIDDQGRQRDLIMPREIHMVDNNVKTVNAMAQAVRKEFVSFNPRMTFPQQMESHRRSRSRGYRGYRGQQGPIYRGGQGKQEKSYRGQRGHGPGHKVGPGFGSRDDERHVHKSNEAGGVDHRVTSRQWSGDTDTSSRQWSGDMDTSSRQWSGDMERSSRQWSGDMERSSRQWSGDMERSSRQWSGDMERSSRQWSGDMERSSRQWSGDMERSSRQWSGDLERSGLLETQSTPEGIRIILRKGNIQDAFSDVIVNTISEDLDLSKGAVSKALLQTAGPQLQIEARTHLAKSGSSNLNYGDIVVTDGYNLNCQWVFHTVCPFWKTGSSKDEVLKEIIANCLMKAEKNEMASISFPAIGTGNLGFPRNLVSSILLRQIHSFSARVPPQYLKEVTVIVHPSDSETVQCFIKSFRGQTEDPTPKGAHAMQQSRKTPDHGKSSQSASFFGTVSTPTLGVHSVQVGNLTLEVSSGDITREKSDAIVNPSNQSFSLKSGVSKAILDGAGLTVELECAQIVNTLHHKPKEMIVTSGGQLPCRNIIHIMGRNSPETIKDAVYSVLKLCEEKTFSSVSFPALGTGQGGASPSSVADAMIDAVVDFVKKKKKGAHLQSVKFIVFQASMLPEFLRSMLKRQQETIREESTMMEWFKDKFDSITNYFTGDAMEQPPDEEFVMVGEEFEPAVFHLCGESPQDVTDARDVINSLIMKEQTKTVIQDSNISNFTREDADALSALQKDLTVSIRQVKSGAVPVIHVEGLTRDVVKAESQIKDMIRKVEKAEARRREAFLLSSLVEWQYLDSKNNLVPFDLLTNYDLEEAFKCKQPRLKIKINNEQYEANLTRRMAHGTNRMIELKRTDYSNTLSVTFPKNWDDLNGGFVLQVQIQEGTQEFMDVETEFRKTGLTHKILDLKRIQNSTLWSSYFIQKKHLDAKNNHTNNEMRLFHGTSPDNIDKITHQGFNRSYAGTHGTMYGNGVYFAVDPAYSAQGYSKADSQGHKRMFLAKVLVGEYTHGKSGLLAPPAKSATATDLYDSVTDNMQNPSMFVIFHDVQAYPEYLITFQ